MTSTKHLSWDLWLIWWTPFDQFGSQWHGVTFIRKWVKQEIHKPIDRIPWKGFCDWIGTPKKTLYYLMSWHDTSPPHRNHWRRLHGFMAGSPGSSFGDHRQVRRLSRYSYSDQHMNWIFLSRTKNIQIKIPMKYFYPGQKYSDQHTDWIFLFRTKKYSDQNTIWIFLSRTKDIQINSNCRTTYHSRMQILCVLPIALLS